MRGGRDPESIWRPKTHGGDGKIRDSGGITVQGANRDLIDYASECPCHMQHNLLFLMLGYIHSQSNILSTVQSHTTPCAERQNCKGFSIMPTARGLMVVPTVFQ